MKYLISITMIILTACATSTTAIQTAIAKTQAYWTPVATQTRYPTYTPHVFIQKVFVEVFVTSTAPTNTPRVIIQKVFINVFATPAAAAIEISSPLPPTAIPDRRRARKGDGVYLVNVDIASGVWQSTGTSQDSCYWELTTKAGDIFDNYSGMAGGTVNIPVTAFQIQLRGCGDWVFLSP